MPKKTIAKPKEYQTVLVNVAAALPGLRPRIFRGSFSYRKPLAENKAVAKCLLVLAFNLAKQSSKLTKLERARLIMAFKTVEKMKAEKTKSPAFLPFAKVPRSQLPS